MYNIATVHLMIQPKTINAYKIFYMKLAIRVNWYREGLHIPLHSMVSVCSHICKGSVRCSHCISVVNTHNKAGDMHVCKAKKPEAHVYQPYKDNSMICVQLTSFG